MSAKVPPVVLSNHNPFSDPAFLRDYAAERARHACPYPPPPPVQPAEPVHTGRKTTRYENPPQLPFPIERTSWHSD